MVESSRRSVATPSGVTAPSSVGVNWFGFVSSDIIKSFFEVDTPSLCMCVNLIGYFTLHQNPIVLWFEIDLENPLRWSWPNNRQGYGYPKICQSPLGLHWEGHWVSLFIFFFHLGDRCGNSHTFFGFFPTLLYSILHNQHNILSESGLTGF